MQTTETKKGLLLNIEKRLHQHVNINSIELGIHYNYLTNRFYITVWIDDILEATNIMVLPNTDILDGMRYRNRDNQPAGSLIFAAEEKSITKENFFDIQKVRPIYFEEVTAP